MEQGHDVSGITMQLWDYADGETGCCSLNDVFDARQAANQIGIEHHVVNYKEDFQKYVVTDFIDKYYNGQTPNPCIMCNEYMKFDFLLKKNLLSWEQIILLQGTMQKYLKKMMAIIF